MVRRPECAQGPKFVIELTGLDFDIGASGASSASAGSPFLEPHWRPADRHMFNIDRFGNTSLAGWVTMLAKYREKASALVQQS